MTKQPRVLLMLAPLPLLLTGCGVDQTDEPETGQSLAFVCIRSGDVFAAGSAESPGLHPVTGRRTLVRGLYCPQCRKWYPAPPLDMLQRTPGAAICRITRTPMNVAGPLPGPSIKERRPIQ